MFGHNNVGTIHVQVPTVKTSDAEINLVAPCRMRVTDVYLVADATLAASDTNKCTVVVTNLEDDGAGTGVVATAVNSVAGGVFTADVAKAMTVGATEALKRVEKGEVLQITTTEAGTLVNDANLGITIAYQNV